MSTAPRISALERLKKAANLQPIKKTVMLQNGDKFEFFCTPLTMAERERAERAKKDDKDYNTFGIQLLVLKALDENGRRLFQAGHIAELKHEVRDADIQELLKAVISNKEDGFDDVTLDVEFDPKN